MKLSVWKSKYVNKYSGPKKYCNQWTFVHNTSEMSDSCYHEFTIR